MKLEPPAVLDKFSGGQEQVKQGQEDVRSLPSGSALTCQQRFHTCVGTRLLCVLYNSFERCDSGTSQRCRIWITTSIISSIRGRCRLMIYSLFFIPDTSF
jgi:hypothetical protein